MEDVNNASNNQFDMFGVFQKRGLDPFDETDFKPNGADKKPSDLFLFDRPANGKRHADHFDDDDDDLGPETNIDEVLSPKLGSINEEKMDTLDVDLELQRQQSSEFEPAREPREETPTPPADTELNVILSSPTNSLSLTTRLSLPVLDSSGLAENVAESEESEDEWNYYKVDPTQKETTLPPVATNIEVSQQDEMSQLNPDAKEFVPVSPTRVAGSPLSPVDAIPRDLVDDTLIAQSPRRAVPMDISVPSLGEFQIEVKQRPSELFDADFKDKDIAEQNGHALSTQEIMQNLLNGKDASEIEFLPQNFICDNQNETETTKSTTPSEEIPTESSMSPTKDNSDFSAFIPKPEDPMVDSFYQDKEDPEFSTNPLDLNKVQVLPEDINYFIQPANQQEEQISPAQSPLGFPLADTPVQTEEQVDLLNQFVDNIVLNNIEESKSPLLNFTPYVPLPAPEIENKSLVELANSPIPSIPIAKTPEIKSPDVCDVATSPKVCDITKSPEVCAKTPEICDITRSKACTKSPEVCNIAISPEVCAKYSEVCDIAKSPDVYEIAKSSEIAIHSPEPEISSPVCEIAKSPLLEQVCEVAKSAVIKPEVPAKSATPEPSASPLPLQEVLQIQAPLEHSPLGPLSPKSPIPELTGLVSPDITASIKDENLSAKECEPKSPEPPVQELKEEVKVAQNFEQSLSELVEQTTDLINKVGDDIHMKIDSTVAVEDLITDAIQDVVENSLISSEVPSIYSFLERSTVPEVASAVSPTEPPETWKQSVEIKCDVLKPEFVVHTTASPSEDISPPAVNIEIEVKKETVEPQEADKITTVKPEVKAAKTTKSKPLAAKKPSLASPNKPLPPKTTTTPSAIKRSSTTTNSVPAKPKPSTTPVASPRAANTRNTKKPLEKKPLSNGDAKPAAKTTLVKKTTTTVAKTTSSTIAEKKLSPVKPPTTRPGSIGMTKPSTARSNLTSSTTIAAKTTSSTTAEKKLSPIKPPTTRPGSVRTAKPSTARSNLTSSTTTAAKTISSTTSITAEKKLSPVKPPTTRPGSVGTAKPSTARSNLTSSARPANATTSRRPANLTPKPSTTTSAATT